MEVKAQGGNDKDFLKMVSSSMENIKNQQKYIMSVSEPFSEDLAKRIFRGEFKGSSWFYNNSDNLHQYIQDFVRDVSCDLKALSKLAQKYPMF